MSAPAGGVVVHHLHPAWNAAWAGLAECHGFDTRHHEGCPECNPNSGECWQLMGAYRGSDGADLAVEFRHRDHPRHGRIYRTVRLSLGSLGWTWIR